MKSVAKTSSALACILSVLSASLLSAAEPTYWQDIRPVLRKHCTACHNAKNLKEVDVSGGLALDSYEAIVKRAHGVVIHPGKSSESRLVKMVLLKNPNRRMPQGAPALSPETINLIRRWIDSGAKEGAKPADASSEIITASPARRRRLDVTLPTNAVPPKDVLGPGNPGKLELALKVGPLAPVAAVVFSLDGKLLAEGSYGQVTIWDLATVRPAKVLTNVLGAVNDIRFSPDGKLLAVAGGQPSAKGDLRLYQVGDWKLLGTLTGHDDVVFSVAFSPDGKYLASASFDKTVRIWDLATHKLERTLTGHSDFVYAVAYSPDGKWLVSASKDRSVKLVDTATGKGRFTFSGMNQDVLAVAVSPDGKFVVSSGYESGIYWWNPQNGERTRVNGGHSVAVHELCFSKDGQLLASAGGDQVVWLWNGSTGAGMLPIRVGSMVYAIALSPDGKQVASGSFDGLVRLWDTTKGRQLLTLLSLPAIGPIHDWLALTPEGHALDSEGLSAHGEWRMAGQAITGDAAWKSLRQADAVAKAARGQALPPVKFTAENTENAEKKKGKRTKS